MTETSEKEAVEQDKTLQVLARDLEPYRGKTLGSLRIDMDEVQKILSVLDRLRTPEPTEVEPVAWPDESDIADLVRDFDAYEDKHCPNFKGDANVIARAILALFPAHPPTGGERAQIVAWMRGPAFTSRHPEDAAFARHVATAIERGDAARQQPLSGYDTALSALVDAEVVPRLRSLNDGRDASSEAPSVAGDVPADVRKLVIAARRVLYENDPQELGLMGDFEKAVELFAGRVRWDDEPSFEDIAALSTVADQGEGEKCPCCGAPCITEAGPAHSVTLEDENGDYYTEQRLGLKTYRYVAQPSGEGA